MGSLESAVLVSVGRAAQAWQGCVCVGSREGEMDGEEQGAGKTERDVGPG